MTGVWWPTLNQELHYAWRCRYRLMNSPRQIYIEPSNQHILHVCGQSNTVYFALAIHSRLTPQNRPVLSTRRSTGTTRQDRLIIRHGSASWAAADHVLCNALGLNGSPASFRPRAAATESRTVLETTSQKVDALPTRLGVSPEAQLKSCLSQAGKLQVSR